MPAVPRIAASSSSKSNHLYFDPTMKQKLFCLAALAAFALSGNAQPTWFPDTVGATLTYERNNNGRKEQFQYKITGVSEDEGKITITFDNIIPGVDNPKDCKVWTAEGRFHTDVKTLMGQYGDVTGAKGHGPILPEQPSVGMTLAESKVEIPGILTTATFSKASFTKHEKITVPAGTFDCWCLEYDTQAKVGFIKSESHTIVWYAKGIGTVKEETWGKKKLMASTELVSVEGMQIPDGDWITLQRQTVELGPGGGDMEGGNYVPEKLEAPAAIDLGLSVKWANRNLGAEKPQDEGITFAWGETDRNKIVRGWQAYKWGGPENIAKYNASDKLVVLAAEDDPACVYLEDGWRLPTAAEITEFLEKCSFEVVDRSGVTCCKATGPSGRFVFLPILRSGDTANYWTSSRDAKEVAKAHSLQFAKGALTPADTSVERIVIAMIRPVYTK
jgi:hypothetical protein